MKARSLPSCRSRTSCRSLPGRRRAFTASLLNDYRSFWVRPFAAAVGWPRSSNRRGGPLIFHLFAAWGDRGPLHSRSAAVPTAERRPSTRKSRAARCCGANAARTLDGLPHLHSVSCTEPARRAGGPLQSASGRAAVLLSYRGRCGVSTNREGCRRVATSHPLCWCYMTGGPEEDHACPVCTQPMR